MSKWQQVELELICNKITDGSHNPPQGLEFSKYMMLSSKNVLNNNLTFENPRYLSEKEFTIENKRTQVAQGDVLLTIVGAIGRTTIVGNDIPPIVFQRSVAVLKPNENLVVPKYMMYTLMSMATLIENEANGVAQKGIYLNQLKKLIIPLPPIEIQTHIAETLDKASEVISLNKKRLEELDNLIKSIFYNMFGDPLHNQVKRDTTTLDKVVTIIMGQSPSGDSYNSAGEGTPLLNGPTEFGDTHPIEKQWTTKPSKLCQREDILFCVRGATAGRMNLADKEYCIGRGLAAIRTTKEKQEYIYLYLESMYDFFQSTSNGSTFINISKDQLASLPITITNETTEKEFTRLAKSIKGQMLLVKKAINESENLFNSLMNQYFD